MPDPSPVPYISPADVVACVSAMEPALKERLGETPDRDRRKLSAALCVFSMYFGPDWVLSRMQDTPFIRPPIQEPMDSFKTIDRVVNLAEHLVNLQDIAGFRWCLDEVRSDSFESGLAKVAAAGMLRRRGIPFHFIVPAGKLGQDYDAEAIIGATRVPIEIKAKVEGNQPSSNSVVNTLKRARKQFPRDTPNVVFLRVPEHWGESADGLKAITEGILEEFRRSSTISMVAAHWERWSQSREEPGSVERRDRHFILVNKLARIQLAALETALFPAPPSGTFPWLSFDDLFGNPSVK